MNTLHTGQLLCRGRYYLNIHIVSANDIISIINNGFSQFVDAFIKLKRVYFNIIRNTTFNLADLLIVIAVLWAYAPSDFRH